MFFISDIFQSRVTYCYKCSRNSVVLLLLTFFNYLTEGLGKERLGFLTFVVCLRLKEVLKASSSAVPTVQFIFC